MRPAMIRWIVALAGGIAVLSFAVHRDWRFTREYMGDLRNRVVGARIIKDGGSPYFYHWREGDSLRYYDPQAFDHNKPSITTSTPFLHRLMIPFANLPESRLIPVWGVLLWLIYLGMVLYALRLARAEKAWWAVCVTALLFLLTNAWELHFKYGQTYLLIAAVGMLFFALVRREGSKLRTVAAGLAAGCLVLMRLNTVFFFLPFLPHRFWRKWTVVLPVILLFGWTLLSGRERNLWGDYFAMLREQVKVHQDLGPAVIANDPDPHFRYWEGLDMDSVQARINRDPVRIYSENGNVFVVVQKLFGGKMPLWLLGLSGMTAIAVVLASWFVLRGRQVPDIRRAAIVGFSLYMISDLFSPIYRHQYNEVQWIMPLLLAASLYCGRLRLIYGWLLLCLLLNIVYLPFIPMANTIGEYGFLAGLLVIGF